MELIAGWRESMERLRSKQIEPFDYEEADVSDALWFGEGFTNYFDGLILGRAQVLSSEAVFDKFAGIINAMTLSPGRQFRSAVEMSRLAPFTDAAVSIDRTAWNNLFISYYTYGSAIAMGLDLSLRDRSDGKLTLDSYMHGLDIHTAVQHHLPITYVIFNNRAHGMCLVRERLLLGAVAGYNEFGPASIGRGLHAMFPALPAADCGTGEQLSEALQHLSGVGGPAVVCVELDEVETPPFVTFRIAAAAAQGERR